MSVRIALHQAARRALSLKSSSSICGLRIMDYGVPLQQPRNRNNMVAIGGKRWMTNKTESEESELLYEGPMGAMITPLKLFSLTSAVLSVVGLPAILLFRGIEHFEAVHIMMVCTTTVGSIGSTVGLQWIFAPYVYTLEKIPIRQCSVPDDNDEKETSEEETQSTSPTASSKNVLLKATTRSILATKVEHVFDPEVDVEADKGGSLRPFLNFYVKGKPLFIHEQMIKDPKVAQHLFLSEGQVEIPKQKNPDPDDEFL